MSNVPHYERPPAVKEPWLGIWRFALRQMQAQGTWTPVCKPLLDEYVAALRLAVEHRALAEADPVQVNRESGLQHMHAGFSSADREHRRAQALAVELLLTPKAQRALIAAAKAAEKPASAKSSVFDALDELGARRQAASA